MRKIRFFVVAFAMAAVLVTACKKDKSKDIIYDGKVEFAGGLYDTMQQAVDAACAAGSGTISLTGNVRGDGVVVNSNFSGVLSFEFGGFTYSLNDGAYFDMGCANAIFGASGGALKGSGQILKSEKGSLVFDKQLTVKGDIRLSSEIIFANDFAGSFAGNVILNAEHMFISAPKGSFDINVLELKGSDACVELVGVPAGCVKIGKVIAGSDCKYPVRADSDSKAEIGSGAAIHVHNMTLESETPATCMTPAMQKYVCAECGHVDYRRENQDLGACPIEKLVHIASVQATASQNGVKEHWKCPLCGKCYADAEGKQQITDGVSILATNYTDDYNDLHLLDKELDWRLEVVQTNDPLGVAGIVLSVIGLAQSIGMSLPGLISSDSAKWREVNDKLDQIKSSLAVISTQIERLADKVDAVPYKTYILDRNTKFNFLDTKSVTVYQLINDYLQDKSLNDEQKSARIKNVLNDWSANVFGGTQIADLTQSLIQQYTKTGLVTVPKMFEEVANCSYMWEHEGYNFRYQSMARDVMLSSISYLMACHYVSSVKEYRDENLRARELQTLKDDYKVYTDAVKAELDRIKDRDAKYRRLNTHKITFDRCAKSYDFYNWFETHRGRTFPRENQDGRAVDSCESILKDLGLDKDLGLTAQMAKEIYNYYNRKNKTSVSIYTILRDSVGFYALASRFDPDIIFTKNDDGFGHENGDSAIPTYKIFHWESYRSSTGNDYFGIRSGLTDAANTENHNIMLNCDINSRSSGVINRLGTKSRWYWCTLVKVEDLP